MCHPPPNPPVIFKIDDGGLGDQFGPSGLPCTRCGVLLTRPLDDSRRLAKLIEGKGLIPIISPFLQIHLRTPALPRHAQALLVTSARALTTTTPWPIPVLAVGNATAALARQAGFTNVTSAQGDATALAALAARTLDPARGPLLLLSGAGQGAPIATALRQAHFTILRRVTYASTPVRRFPPEATAALLADTLQAAIFLSGETAAAFVRLLPASHIPHLPGVRALAIGKTAFDALKPLPWADICLAATPTLDDVLALL